MTNDTGNKLMRWAGTRSALWVWLAVMATAEALLCRQGLSVHDSGVYLSGYLHFASEPEVNSYLGQWLLSYLGMGWLCGALGIKSFLGLRLVHVALMALAHAGIYRWATHSLGIRPQLALLGLVMAALCHVQGYSEVNYNELSALLLIAVTATLTGGIHRRKPWRVAAAGALVAVAVAARVVNVWFVALPAVAWLAGDRSAAWGSTWLAWLGGGLAGAAAVLAVLWASGTLSVVGITARTMLGMASAGSSTHGIDTLVWTYAGGMGHTALSGITLMAVAAVVAAAMWGVRGCGKAARAVAAAVCAAIGAVTLWRLNSGPVCNYAMFLSMATLAVMAVRLGQSGMRTAAALWLAVLVLYPLGSAASNAVNGPYFLHLALPLAVAGMASGIQSAKGRWRTALCRTAAVMAAALAMAMIKLNATHGLFQDQKRTACHYEIYSPATRGICTNEANAQLHNWLIAQLRPHLRPGQYAICNFSLPLISMLDCRPYAYAESEWVDDSAVLCLYIDEAHKASRRLPAFIIDSRRLNACDAAVMAHCRRLAPYSTVWSSSPYSLVAPN